MKKIIVTFVVLVVVGLVIWKFRPTVETSSTDKPTIKIGVSLPLSGDIANIGKTNMLAVKMDLDKWKERETKYNYEVVFEDDAFSAKQANLNANKFINVDKVKATLSMWAVAGFPMTEVADRNKVIHFNCATGDEIAKPEYSFNNYTNTAEISSMMADKLKKENVRKVAYFTNLSAMTDEAINSLSASLEAVGIDVVDIEKFNIGTKDFRIAIMKAEEKQPDYYVILPSNPADMAVLIKQFYEITGKRNITSIDTFYEMPKETRDLVEGLWFVKSSFGTDEFLKKFESVTGREGQSCTGNLYDNLDLLIWAFENTMVEEGEVVPSNIDVVRKLQTVKKYNGAIGELSIDDKGLVRSKAMLSMVKDGEAVTIK